SNTLNGVAASGSSALAIGDGGQVYQSTDGGASYAASAPAAAGGNNLNGLTTSSSFGQRGARKGDGTVSTEGFGSAVAVGVGGTILRSGDGGGTWSSVQSSGNTLNDVASTGNLGTARVGKSDGTVSTEGFGSAVAVGIGGTILRSGNGGESWNAAASGSSATLNGVAVADDFVLRGARKGDGTLSTEGFGSAVAVGVGGTILRSGDGGESWNAAFARAAKGNVAASTNAITSQNLNAVSFASQSIVVVTGDGGTILRSTDSGASWSIIGSGTAKNLTSVKMINASDGYIAGEIGTLLKTTDGGETWNREGSPTTEDLNAIAITGNGTAFSAGTASTVVKTETGTSAIVDNNSGTKPEVFALSQNYPNPFNPSTTIRYQLPASGDVKLRLYDVLGREVASLVGGRQAAGNYAVQFNARGLSSGVYFYKLSVSGSTGNFVSTKKMTLLK
ncbi:MAG: T9SS type A sorting domain-containing protein, partial [Rhizobacter sp.]|nr:T9SS type A sorting domain-containing protein [Chlorobiales bacterium]